jgi:HEAT repeat protein
VRDGGSLKEASVGSAGARVVASLVVLLAGCAGGESRSSDAAAGSSPWSAELAQLDHGDSYARRRAVTALIAIGPDVLPALGERLSNPDTAVRDQTVVALAAIGGPAADEAIGRALSDPARSVRERAAAALIARGPETLPAFAETLKNPDHNVREDVVRALPRFGPQALVVLEVATRDPDVRVQRSTVAALAAVGRPARPLLRAIADTSGHDSIALAARRALVQVATESRGRAHAPP